MSNREVDQLLDDDDIEEEIFIEIGEEDAEIDDDDINVTKTLNDVDSNGNTEDTTKGNDEKKEIVVNTDELSHLEDQGRKSPTGENVNTQEEDAEKASNTDNGEVKLAGGDITLEAKDDERGVQEENIEGDNIEEDAEQGEKEEEDEEINENTPMTDEEKLEMVEAVLEEDTARFFNAIDKINADINMTWFNENLLMIAMRNYKPMMCEFLIDLGINVEYAIDIVDVKETEKHGKRFYCYRKTCRQIAYEMGLEDIVDLIDLTTNNWFPYKKKPDRAYYKMRPRAPPPPKVPGELSEGDEEEDGSTNDLVSTVNGDLAEDQSGKKKNTMDKDKKDLNEEHDEICANDSISVKKIELVDDGYETMTPRSSPCLLFQQPYSDKDENRNLYRNTRASFALKRHTASLMPLRKPCRHSQSAKVPSDFRTKSCHAADYYTPQNETKTWVSKTRNDLVPRLPYINRPESSVSSYNGIVTSRKPRPHSSPIVPISAQVTKILEQSTLLRPQKQHKSHRTKSGLTNHTSRTSLSSVSVQSFSLSRN